MDLAQRKGQLKTISNVIDALNTWNHRNINSKSGVVRVYIDTHKLTDVMEKKLIDFVHDKDNLLNYYTRDNLLLGALKECHIPLTVNIDYVPSIKEDKAIEEFDKSCKELF